MNPKTNQIRIERLALDGDGIGRLENGQAAFVPYSLPSEQVQARLLLQKKNHSRWLPLNVVSPAASRVMPRCPQHFQPGKTEKWCGGCDWQHMELGFQRTAKRQLVIETLERLGGISQPPVRETVSSPLEWRYRNKVQVPFGKKGKMIVAGFFSPGSHDIVEFDDCYIQPSLSVEIVRFVKDFANKHYWPVYNEDEGRGWIRHLIIRTNDKNEALVALVTCTPGFLGKKEFISELTKLFPRIVGVHQNVQPAKTNVILGQRWISLWGRSHISESLAGLNFRYSAGSFFQVNRGAAERLYNLAIEELQISSTSTVLDLYCGVGAMTLLAAKKGVRAIGVEPVRTAVNDARENASRNQISNVTFVENDSEGFFREKSRLFESLQSKELLVIIDPPRTGCTEPVLNGLLALRPRRMVYVSCHPATLARDLKALSHAYNVVSVTPVDLFPQTSHIETVTQLEPIAS